MKVILLTLFTAFLLVGCGKENVRYERYPVPVYQVPSPPEIERPELPIYTLSSTDVTNTTKVMQSYVISFRLLLNYTEALESIVATYERLSEDSELPEDYTPRTRALSATDPESERDEQLTEAEEIIIMSDNARIYDEAQEEFNKIEQEYKQKEQEIREQFDEPDE